ncbi:MULTISPECIES: surface lipoprotein assembly modifier [unclassified Neptuniibacter]|uniref:surface lipoprotein assembly modifier n=1 Tax=unclassified Neptuniibacter TaxID=2630693 RepID=UPI0025DD2E9F|nr:MULTISPECIES: surface lipoprotein assembly modifier [unclassified Neptuniibacter]|tara:strand:+ start:21354 stop:22628 length:1275 start_codon:yes stop_codon:yes gene_type:complete
MKNFSRGSILSGVVLSVMASSVIAADTTEEQFDPEAFFKQGMKEREEGAPYKSIESFQTILSNKPALHRARLELAVAYMQTLQYQEAEQQAQAVLDDPQTPPSVRVSILAFLAQLKKDAEQLIPQHDHKFNLSAGILFDSNVNVGPSSDVININGDILDITSGQPISDSALVLTAGYDHSYRTGKTLRFGQSTGMLFWQSGATLYNRGYDEEGEFDLTVLSLRTGPAIVTNSKFRGNIALQADHIRLGDEKLANYIGLQPSLTWAYDASTEFTIDAEVTERDFEQETDQGRDSEYYSVGASLGKGYKNNTVGVQAGIEYFNNQAREAEYSNDGWGAYAGINWQVKPEGSVFSRLSYNESEYGGIVTGVGKVRDEEEIQLIIGGKHMIANEFELSLLWMRTEAESNVELYEYERNQISFNVSRKF